MVVDRSILPNCFRTLGIVSSELDFNENVKPELDRNKIKTILKIIK